MSGLICLDEVDSTISYLKRRIGELPDGTAVMAEVQTTGRGRRGHSWVSDGGMLPLSVLLKNPPQPATVTLCCGAAVCMALEAAGAQAGIKWPNDVIVSAHKVCGILCESVCSGDNISVVVGLGVNISQSEEFFRAAGIPHAGSLKQLAGISPDKTELAEDIAERVRTLCAMDFSEVYGLYKPRCVTLGRQVRLIENGAERIAFARDIAENGFLVCEDENGRFEVSASEVSVRGIMGYV